MNIDNDTIKTAITLQVIQYAEEAKDRVDSLTSLSEIATVYRKLADYLDKKQAEIDSLNEE